LAAGPRGRFLPTALAMGAFNGYNDVSIMRPWLGLVKRKVGI
jgi:hypothetical protein